MLSEKISVTQIGLNQADLRLIETVFKLSAELKQSYILHTEKLATNPDIVFIDADSAQAQAQCNELQQHNKHMTVIRVSSDSSATNDPTTLSRPLSLKKLMSSLQSVTSTENKASNVSALHSTAKQILVVDDSYSVRKYMEHKLPELANGAVNVEFADSGETAMQLIEKKQYDMIFLDVVMPGIDGYQVCKWIKSEHPTYVVMLTSKKSPFDKVRGNMSGCNAYITKPPKDERIEKVLKKGIAASNRKQSGKPEEASFAV